MHSRFLLSASKSTPPPRPFSVAQSTAAFTELTYLACSREVQNGFEDLQEQMVWYDSVV
ncbi:hypothetical protein CK203_008394 [Vitis vinifera]|uniref:Uncharacterized protein n=1 Tax=Vitis vinifera TaxID=29760 RepID=A0A438F966_VITVI|nr:hypothetical protein CK203_072497 [Vitis vinifera]RVX22945.1 hypothetical protein CK203_008394 [Vitis vinifera]